MAEAHLRWKADTGEAMAKTEALKREISSVGGSSTTNALKKLGDSWTKLVPAIAGAGVAVLALTNHMAVLAPLVPIVTVAVAGLLVPFTSLAAIFVGLIPPVLLLTGLLGGLAAAFAYVAVQSFKNKASAQQVHDNLLKLHVAQQTYNQDLAKYGKTATQTENALLALHKAQDTYEASQQGVALGAVNLEEKFHDLVGTLEKRFAPAILFLAQSAGKALVYLNKIAQLPLAKAFRDMSTTGVQGLTKFLEKIGHFVANPIRVAFRIAFGGDSTLRNSLLGLWTQIMKFFTQDQTHKIHIGSMIATTTTAAPFTLVQKWFGRQDFTGLGMRWAMELATAFVNGLGNVMKRMWATHTGKFVLTGALTGAVIGSYFGPIGTLIGTALGTSIGFELAHFWPTITKDASKAFHAVGNAIKKAIGPTEWAMIISLAKSFWDTLKSIGGYIQNHIWPVVKHVFNALGGWHTVLTIIVVAIRLIVATWIIAANTIKIVYNAIQTVVHWVQRAANAVKNQFAGSWDEVLTGVDLVLNAVSSIVDGIKTAVGWATKLANALSSGLGGSPGSPGGNAGPSTGKGHAAAHRTALGGIVTSPQMRWVGEAGPEAIIPLSGYRGRNALAGMSGARGGGRPLQVNLVLDRKVITSVLVDAEKTYRRQNAGRSLFAV